MKNTVKIASVIAFAVLTAACTKMAPSKYEVEAGFEDAYQGAIPEVSFAATPSGNAKFDIESGSIYIATKVTVSGVSATAGKIVVGVLSSEKEDFTNTQNSDLVITEDGTYEIAANVSANKVNYIKASISTQYGCSFSDVVKLNISDVPFYGKISGNWAGKVTSLAFGDEYSSNLVISLDKEDPENYCYVGNIEPYYESSGNTVDKGLNYIKCQIDNENNQIILATGSSMNLGGRMYFASDLEGSVLDYDVLTLSEDSKSLVREAAFFTVKPDGSAEDWYGPATYKKK